MARHDRTQQSRRKLVFALGVGGAVFSIGVIMVLSRTSPPPSSVTINGQSFQVELADTEPKRTVGLMFRKELPERTGMLFIFDKADLYPFWMQNTYISLDIIYLDEQKRIINVCTMPPLTESTCRPDRPARYVLELSAGSAKQYNLEPGQQAEFRLSGGR